MDITDVFIPRSLVSSLTAGGTLITGDVLGDTDGLARGEHVQLRGKSGATYRDPDWRVFFEGHCLSDPDNLTFDKFTSRAQMQIGTANHLLAGHLQAIGFAESSSPQHEHQITGMTLAKIAEHILKRHCNAVNQTRVPEGPVTVLNINFTDSTSLALRNIRAGENLWKRVQEVGGGDRGGEFFGAWFSRLNEFYYDAWPAFWTSPPTSKGTLTNGHIKGRPRVKLNNNKVGEQIGQVKLLTVGGGTTVYSAEYPANPGVGTIREITSGVWANSQARTDTLAERLYKWLTRPYTLQVEVDAGLALFGDDGRGLDLADALTVQYNGLADDGGAGVHLDIDHKFYVHQVRVTFDVEGKAARATLTLEADNP